LGNPLTKTGGFMKEIDNMKERIKQLEKLQNETVDFKKRIYWTVGVIIAIGIILQYLVNIYAAVKK
jgi:hypothetical protein